MTQADPKKADDLDLFFSAAKDETPLMDPAFLARITDEAEGHTPTAKIQPKPAWIARILDGFGGWIGGAGLVTAMAVGLLIGVNPPEAVNTVVENAALFGDDLAWLDDYSTASWEEI